MKHHPNWMPGPDAQAAGMLAESWSAKDSTQGFFKKNHPTPNPKQHTSRTRCINKDKPHCRDKNALFNFPETCNSRFGLGFIFPKIKVATSSRFTILLALWNMLETREDITGFQENPGPCWCCCPVCALANWAARCPEYSNSEVWY